MFRQNVHGQFPLSTHCMNFSTISDLKQLKLEGFYSYVEPLNWLDLWDRTPGQAWLKPNAVYSNPPPPTSGTCSVWTSHCYLHWNWMSNKHFNLKLIVQFIWDKGKKVQICVCLENYSCNECCSGREEVWGWRPLGRKETGIWSNVGVWKDICAGEADMYAEREEAECVRKKVRGDREEGWRNIFLPK